MTLDLDAAIEILQQLEHTVKTLREDLAYYELDELRERTARVDRALIELESVEKDITENITDLENRKDS